MSDDALVNKLRELTGGETSDETAIAPQSWDSVDVLDLIAAIDESYDVTVPIEQLNACTTIGELRQLIRTAAAGS